MPALQKAPAWSTFIFQISTRVFKTRFPQKNRLKLAGRPPLLPLRSPVQSQTGIRVGVQQLFELGPNLEKGALSTVSVWLETNRVSREGSNLRQSCPLMSRRRRTTDGMPRKRCGANPYAETRIRRGKIP